MRIEPQYIKESARIIKEYNIAIKNLAEFENKLTENKSKLLSLKTDIDKLISSTEPELLKKSKLSDILSVYDNEISNIKTTINPFLETIEQLKKDSTNLYTILKEKYSGLTDDQLQQQIFYQLDELKKTQ